jgi:hypothetical protein
MIKLPEQEESHAKVLEPAHPHQPGRPVKDLPSRRPQPGSNPGTVEVFHLYGRKETKAIISTAQESQQIKKIIKRSLSNYFYAEEMEENLQKDRRGRRGVRGSSQRRPRATRWT